MNVINYYYKVVFIWWYIQNFFIFELTLKIITNFFLLFYLMFYFILNYIKIDSLINI